MNNKSWVKEKIKEIKKFIILQEKDKSESITYISATYIFTFEEFLEIIEELHKNFKYFNVTFKNEDIEVIINLNYN